MKVECPVCQAKYEIDAEYIGRKINCPSCNKDFEVKNPNLMPCPDCFCMISKRAVMGPRCGAPVNGYPFDTANKTSSAPNTSEEKEILVCHPSAMNYLWGIIFGILTLPVVIGIFILLFVWIEIHYTSYRITNLRIIVRRGLIAKFQNEIWIKDMRGANLVQGIWQRLIGVGNISVGTAATAGTEICMAGIRNPQKVVDTINSLRN